MKIKLLNFIFLCSFLLSAPTVFPQQEQASPSRSDAGAPKQPVRIQCLFGNSFLYADGESGVCRYAAELKEGDAAGHWILQPVPDVDAVWIVNVKTGQALNIEDQAGWVQLGNLQKTFHSYRWRVSDKGDYVFLESAWREGHGLSLENQQLDKVGIAGLNDEWWSLRFRLIPVVQ